MPLHHRDMQAKDIEECMAILASHPTVAARYGSQIGLLAESWRGLLSCEAKSAVVVIDEDGSSHPPICCFGFSIFAKDDFVREMKTAPQFWVGPELIRRLLQGKSPVLSDRELQQANIFGGINLVVWESLVRPGYESNQELQRLMMTIFIQYHQGYLWKELIAEQHESGERLAFVLRTGGLLWDAVRGRYTDTLEMDPSEIIRRPHTIGITRELELERQGNWAGSWVGALFDYHPPILGLSGSEQRLLTCALSGATDDELAKTLDVSLSSVKQMWLSIYRRAEDSLPEAMADLLRPDSAASGRGKEKRRLIVAYIREHPEELRPVPRKRLSKGAASGV